MDAKNITKFLDKISMGIDKSSELFLDIKDKRADTGLMNESQSFFVHGSIDIDLPDMQIPVNKFVNLQKSVSTFEGKIGLRIKDNRLEIKGRNVKKIPLCRWKDVGTRIVNRIEKDTEGILPIALKKSEYAIVTQDKEMFDKVTEVFFIQKDKKLDIQIKDETGFESLTTIDDIDLPDGKFILPSVVFDILKKSDNLEIGFVIGEDKVPRAFFRETGNNFEIKYMVTGMIE